MSSLSLLLCIWEICTLSLCPILTRTPVLPRPPTFTFLFAFIAVVVMIRSIKHLGKCCKGGMDSVSCTLQMRWKLFVYAMCVPSWLTGWPKLLLTSHCLSVPSWISRVEGVSGLPDSVIIQQKQCYLLKHQTLICSVERPSLLLQGEVIWHVSSYYYFVQSSLATCSILFSRPAGWTRGGLRCGQARLTSPCARSKRKKASLKFWKDFRKFSPQTFV